MLTLADNRTEFRPGEEIAGVARWSGAEPPQSVEISLCWSTRGRGSEDAGAVQTTAVAHPMAQGEYAFQFTAPPIPYSFAGALITLTWAVELLIEPGNVEHIEIVIAPDARAIKLPRIEVEPSNVESFLRKYFPRAPE